ncbi:MAG: TrmB family transcriptional regulator [Acidobacteria bacterium]|nr:TrmB family transcriptional regulator [Acidobacteriota bacterium]
MNKELTDGGFQRLWRKLQQIGLNAYEARTYMVLVGHPKFKALELAARADVPRQKIYEVLDSLAEKGFARVVQDKTKLFSAVEPALAIPNYFARRHEQVKADIEEHHKLATAMVEDLTRAYDEGREGRGTLDFLRIVSEPGLTAAEFRQMISAAASEYLEFSRPPYAVDPLDEELVRKARDRGVVCRLLLEGSRLDDRHRQRLADYQGAGVLVRQIDSLPMKLAVFDGTRGLVALLDPLVTRPSWTAVVFDHPGMGEAMKGLFEEYWRRSKGF